MSFAKLKRNLRAVEGVRDIKIDGSKLTVRYTSTVEHDKVTVMQQTVASIIAESGLNITFIDYIGV